MNEGAQRPLRIWELLAALVDGGVDFVVIGGVAVGVHGFERATKDVDIVPAPGLPNLERLYFVLEALDAAYVDVDDFRPEELAYPLSVEGLAQGWNWALATRHGRLDVMQYIDGVLEGAEDYEQLASRALGLETPVGRVRF